MRLRSAGSSRSPRASRRRCFRARHPHRDVARRRRGELPRARGRARRRRRSTTAAPRSKVDDAKAADLAPIREAVRALCAEFPGEYWRALDRERAYPEEFVAALTEAGYLAALIPEEYGGSGLGHERRRGDPGGDPRLRLQRRRLPRADVHDGHDAAARQRRAEGALSAEIARGELRLQAFGVTEPTTGTDTLAPAHHRAARRRPLRRQRPEDLDLARRAFRPDAAAGAHHAARAGQEAHRRAFRCFWSTCASVKATA